MSQITVSNLSFSYDGSYDMIFDQVSFQLDTDWKLGFIGRNGRGKTTFLKLLMGELEYSGHISSKAPFTYYPCPVQDQEQFTIDVIQETCPNAEYWEIERELSLLQVADDVLYRPFSSLSGGEQAKALLAGCFLDDTRFLLIDEPTNHLDLEARRTVGNYLNRKKGFILVSHDREFLDSCIDHVLSINKANIEIQQGNFSSWWHNKEMRDQFEAGEHEKLHREIKHLQDAAAKTASWSDTVEKQKHGWRDSGLRPDRGYLGHKSAKMMKRSKSAQQRKENALEKAQSLLQNVESNEPLKLHPLNHHANRIIQLRDVAVQFDRKLFSGLNFEMQSGDRIALTGKNGSGKSTILKLLLGACEPTSGTVTRASNLKISYVPQDTAGLHGSLSAFAEQHDLDESLFKAILRKLDFSRTQFEKEMQHYSAGQKKKVYLAKSLCEQAHLYIWDEPLNYIDVLSRMQIEDLLKTCEPTIIFVEHDAAFVKRIANKTITLS